MATTPHDSCVVPAVIHTYIICYLSCMDDVSCVGAHVQLGNVTLHLVYCQPISGILNQVLSWRTHHHGAGTTTFPY